MMKPLRDPKYLESVRRFPCCIVGEDHEGPVEAHHAFGQYCGGGTGLKGSDYAAVPLCSRHHRTIHSEGTHWLYTVRMLEAVATCLGEWMEKKAGGQMLKDKIIHAVYGVAAAHLAEGFGCYFQPEEREAAIPALREPARPASAPLLVQKRVFPACWSRVIEIVDQYQHDPKTAIGEILFEGHLNEMTALDVNEIFHKVGVRASVRYVSDEVARRAWKCADNIKGMDNSGAWFVWNVDGLKVELILRRDEGNQGEQGEGRQR